ncbi:hypothetical protein KIPB_015803, partial [Kipferlia bialata]|eukprot:g15803.t1
MSEIVDRAFETTIKAAPPAWHRGDHVMAVSVTAYKGPFTYDLLRPAMQSEE